MSTTETKKELAEEFSGIKYILTSGMRSKLLLAIYDGPKNLDELRNELKKPSATILHGLKFWNSHDLDGIPDDVLKDVYLLKNAEYVASTTSDLSNAFNAYIKLISKAKKLKIIFPIYSENHFKHLIKLVNGKKLKKLELVVNEEILKSIEENELLKKELLNNKKVKIKCVKRKLKVFLTYSEDFMSLTLFFKDGHYDDSQILIAKDKNAIKWAKALEKLYEK